MFATAHKKLKGAALAVLLACISAGLLFPAAPAFAFIGVPVVDIPHTAVSNVTLVQTGFNLIESVFQTAKAFAMHLKEFVGDALANALAKAALRSITQSTVNWINSGFKGSPAFITNPEGFLTDVADQVIGQAIEAAAPLLCSPFQLDIRLALGLNYSFGASREIRCRLTDVIANLEGSYNQFVAGDFRAGGWDSFINIAGVPQNNPYGAYLATQDYLGLQIVSATGQASKRLEFGRGFLDWRECEIPGDPIPIGNTGRTRPGPCKKKGPVKTPGSVIEGQLQNTLGVDLSSLALADEINEIFAALVNQLVKKVFTRGGLASASNYRASFDTGAPVVTGFTNDVAITATGANLLGIETKGRADQETTKGAAFNDRAGGTPIGEQGKLTQGQNTKDQEKANVTVGPEARDGNIAEGKKTKQSSYWINEFGFPYLAKLAVDKSDFTVSITNREFQPWWQVDLGQSEEGEEYQINEIREVEITRRHGAEYQSQNLSVFISDNPFPPDEPVTCAAPMRCYGVPDAGNPVTVLVTSGERGRYIRVQRPDRAHLSLAEVRVFGKDILGAAGAVTPPPEVLFKATFDPGVTFLARAARGSQFQKKIILRANKPGDNISLRISLFNACNPTDRTMCVSGYKKSPTPLSNLFTNFSVTITQGGNQTGPQEFITREGCVPLDRCVNPALKIAPANTVVFAENRSVSPQSIIAIELSGTFSTDIVRESLRLVIEAVKDSAVLTQSVINFGQ